MTSPERGPSPATGELDKQRKMMEEKEREILQSRMRSVTLAAKNKVVNFLRKYILGKKPEDKSKMVDQGKEKEKKEKPEAESESPDQIIDRQFNQIHVSQNMGKPLTEKQQQFISHVAAEAAVDPLAQKELKLEVPETDPSDPTAEAPKKLKPTLATILPGAITPEMLLRYDFSDYEMAVEPDGKKILTLKSSPSNSEKIEELAEKKTEKTEEPKASPEKEYRRRIIPKSEVTQEMLADPEFQKNYEPVEEAGHTYYRKRGLEFKRIAGGADDESNPEVPDPSGEPGRDPRMETGGDTEEEYYAALEEEERNMTAEQRRERTRRNAENERTRQQAEEYEEQVRQARAAQRGLPPEMRGSRGGEREIPQPPETSFIPPMPAEGESTDSESYKQKHQTAFNNYNNVERRASELAAARKAAIYLSMELQAAESETEVHWIIEESLRAGESDWASPETFQQAVQQVIQAVDLVFSGDQQRREQFARLARARMVGYICEFTARFINASGLADNITNYFQDYFEEMRDLPGVRRMMELMEEQDTENEKDADGNPLNIRGAYFRKLNFAKNETKREEWDKYFNLKDLYNPDDTAKKDAAWGQWVVDKKFKLFREAKDKKPDPKTDNIKLDYVENYSDPEDEELVRVLLAKTQSKNNPVKAIKELHMVVFPEFYQEKGLKVSELPEYDYLREKPDIIKNLHDNKKFKAAVRELTDSEREYRRGLLEDKVTLSDQWGISLDRMVYQLNRAVNLGQRMEHSLQFSTHWDNLRWKKWDDMTPKQRELFKQATEDIKHADHGTDRHGHDLEQYGRNAAGELILLNPVVDWAMNDDPRYKGSMDKKRGELREKIKNETDEEKKKGLWDQLNKLTNKTLRVNLRIAAEKRARKNLLKYQIKFEKDDEKKKAIQSEIDTLDKDLEIDAIDDIRGAKNHIFTISVDKTYRDFYEKYWELIDHENSFSGDSSREARKAQFFGRTLEQTGEAEPGKRFMRRFADTGAKDLGMFFAFESGFDMIDNFTGVFNRVKRWGAVLKQGDKLRGVLMDMLNNPEILADPVKFTTEIKKNYRPHMSTDDTWDKEYYSEEEYFEAAHHMENQLDYVTGQWAEAILEYNKDHSWQQHAADLKQEVLTKNVASMVAHELITPHRAAHILDNQFGPLPKRILYEITHVFMRPKDGLLGLLSELLEESGKAWSAGLK